MTSLVGTHEDKASLPPPPVGTGRRGIGGVLHAVAVLVVPVALYDLLRFVGVSIYLALISGALASGINAAVTLVHNRRLDGLAVYMMITMLISVAVSLLVGSERFLLAKEGWLTGLTGVWFLASLGGRRPLAFLFSRPLLEGRLRWPDDWDGLWDRLPRFRRIWQVSSVIFGVGTLADSALRVLMAYTLPVDLVPALGTALYAGTSAVVLVVTNVYYVASGAANRTSALYRPAEPVAPAIS